MIHGFNKNEALSVKFYQNSPETKLATTPERTSPESSKSDALKDEVTKSENYKKLNPEKKAKVDAMLENIKNLGDKLKDAEKIKGHLTRVVTILSKIQNPEYKPTTEEDKKEVGEIIERLGHFKTELGEVKSEETKIKNSIAGLQREISEVLGLVQPLSEKGKEDSKELSTEEKEKIEKELKDLAQKIATEYKFNPENFLSKVQGITYNPKLEEKDEGLRSPQEAETQMREIAKKLAKTPGMDKPPVTDREFLSLGEKKTALESLPEAQKIKDLNPVIDDIARKIDLISRDLNAETDPNKKSEKAKEIEELYKQFEAKKKEQESLKTEPYKKLESEIAELEKKAQQDIKTYAKTNPAGFQERIQQTAGKHSGIIVLINELLKKFLGIDFLGDGTRHGGLNTVGSGLIGGNSALELGSLSEQFESGGKGPDAITGNDANLGFPSYGTYQMNRDTLKEFASKLGIAGNPLEIGDSGEFAKNWKKKIEEMGKDKFKQAERDFVKSQYFEPQLKKIQATGIDTSKFSLTMQNVIWSTAVQHGQNSDIVKSVISSYIAENNENKEKVKKWGPDVEKEIIEKIYAERQRRYPAGAKRYSQEQAIALAQVSSFASAPDGSPRSLPMEFSGSGVTLCSQTARLNASRFGLQLPAGNAKDVEVSYGSQLDRSGNPPSGTYADVFSGSTRYPQYGHRAFAYKNKEGNWYVLDPYLRIQADRQAPIPWGTYMQFLRNSGRGYNGSANVG